MASSHRDPSGDSVDAVLPRFADVRLSAEFAEALPELGLPARAAEAPDPQLSVLNDTLATDLGIDAAALRTPSGAEFLVGRRLGVGSRPLAQLYSGHQFGAYTPVLGDGRALLLGELRTGGGEVRDLHLKGSGRTPPARGDGFAALGPMLREYLVGEAMHALGIPTSRALAVTTTGRRIRRDDFRRDDQHPGAVLARIAASHLRVGTFQFARATRDIPLQRRLLRFAIDRHAPELADSDTPALALLREVSARQARLVASWELVGFVHGVMNTDNVTISGETIDYGPCAFLDSYDPHAVFSSIDHEGRYAYDQQRPIARWNLARFAESLLPLIADPAPDSEEDSAPPAPETMTTALEEAVALATQALTDFDAQFTSAWADGMRAKLGLRAHPGADDERVVALGSDFLAELRTHGADFTRSFRRLAGLVKPGANRSGADHEPSVGWLERWRALNPDPDLIRQTNPVVIPRNHLLEAALEAATDGDLQPFLTMLQAVSHPFADDDEDGPYAHPAPADAPRFVTTCGT